MSDILALFDRRGGRLVAVRRGLAALPPSSRAAARPLALGLSVRGTITVESRFRRSVRLGGRVLMGAYALKDRPERNRLLEDVYERFPLLAERRREKAGNLSGGQQKVLEIGRALMMRPKMMLLDEPSLGLAPKTAKLVFETVKRLNEDGAMTLLMVEQNARQGLAISDRGYVLELGRERLEGPARQLLEDPQVSELYLGARTRNGGGPDGVR